MVGTTFKGSNLDALKKLLLREHKRNLRLGIGYQKSLKLIIRRYQNAFDKNNTSNFYALHRWLCQLLKAKRQGNERFDEPKARL